MPRTLVVIGAGPKAVAIAAKATSLREAGFAEVPEVIVIEQHVIGANWTGKYGFTSGHQPLGTPPEKDLGFPYGTEAFGKAAVHRMFTHFSWHAYLLESEGRYGDWVDRGRPHPLHHQWAEYLQWAWKRSGARLIHGTVERFEPIDLGWRVVYIDNAGEQEITCDGLVLTGPGEAYRVREQPSHDRILDGKTFWSRLDEIENISLSADDAICVIGSGETAAAIVVELSRLFQDSPILVLNRQGTIFSRGEGYHENRMFTDPGEEWTQLAPEARWEVIRRADRGVFSLDTIGIVDRAVNVKHSYADVSAIRVSENQPLGEEVLEVAHGPNGSLTIEAALVIVAIGFDAWGFRNFLPAELRARFEDKEGQDDILARIRSNLAIPDDVLPSPLHVPMIAAFQQGPGFPNLSCLGTLADRILASYVQTK